MELLKAHQCSACAGWDSGAGQVGAGVRGTRTRRRPPVGTSSAGAASDCAERHGRHSGGRAGRRRRTPRHHGAHPERPPARPSIHMACPEIGLPMYTQSSPQQRSQRTERAHRRRAHKTRAPAYHDPRAASPPALARPPGVLSSPSPPGALSPPSPPDSEIRAGRVSSFRRGREPAALDRTRRRRRAPAGHGARRP